MSYFWLYVCVWHKYIDFCLDIELDMLKTLEKVALDVIFGTKNQALYNI